MEEFLMSAALNETWYQVTKLLEEEMTSVSFSTWIETIVPVSIDKNIITLEVPSEFNLGIIKSRYKDLIQNAIKIVTNRDLEIEFYIQNIDGFTETKVASEEISPALSILNPKYTFNTFVKGNGNQLAHAAALAVAEAPAIAYNPLLFMEGRSWKDSLNACNRALCN